MIKAFFTPLPMLVSLFWLVTLFMDKPLRYPRKVLSVMLAVAAALYFGHFAYFNGASAILPYTDTLYSFCNLAVYPLYYLYICSLAEVERLKPWRFLAAVAPAVIIAFFIGLCNAGVLADAETIVRNAGRAVFGVEVVLVVWMGFRKISAYDARLKASYADTEGKTLLYLKRMLVAFILTASVSFAANLIGRSYFGVSDLPLVVVSSVFSALLYIIGYLGYKQEVSAADLKDEIDVQKEGKRDYTALKEKIIRYIEENKLYLRQDLKVSDAAAEMGTNRNYVYNAINVGMGVSFNELINGYRVEHAKVLLKEKPDLPIHEIGYESGFSSDASFYRNFNHFTGTTPEKWRNLTHIDPAPKFQ